MNAIRPFTPEPPPPPAPIFALWHLVHGYAYYRFKDEQAAHDWATVHGHHLDGEISEAFAKRRKLVVEQPPWERSTQNRPSDQDGT